MITVRGKACWPSRGVADLLGIGRNTLLKKLKERKIFTVDNVPMLNYMHKGYFIVEETEHNGFRQDVTYFTKAGMDFVDKLLIDVPRKDIMAGANIIELISEKVED